MEITRVSVGKWVVNVIFELNEREFLTTIWWVWPYLSYLMRGIRCVTLNGQILAGWVFVVDVTSCY